MVARHDKESSVLAVTDVTLVAGVQLVKRQLQLELLGCLHVQACK